MFCWGFFFWQIEIDARYSGKLCGLCGNFDGNPKDLMIEGMLSLMLNVLTQINTSKQVNRDHDIYFLYFQLAKHNNSLNVIFLTKKNDI